MSGIYGIPESFEHREPDPVPEIPPTTSRHKRPPKSVVADRDAQVHDTVRSAGVQGISRTALATSLGLTMHEAYLSLNRLQSSGRIKNTRRNNAHFWVSVADGTETGA